MYQFFEWASKVLTANAVMNKHAGGMVIYHLNKCEPIINASEIEISDAMTFDSLMAMIGEDEAVLA